jgi:hypothetical protein
MKLQATTYTESTTVIASALDALVHERSNDITVTFANGYTVDIYVDYDTSVTVHILKGKNVLTDDYDQPHKCDLFEIKALLCNISRAGSDFDCGFAYHRYFILTQHI